jgi:uncharacterized membrane protein YfcA
VGVDPWTWAALALAVFTGATAQGLVGLGIGLVAAPVTTLLEPSLMPAVLLWLAFVMPVVTLAHEHDAIDWPGLWWSLPTRVVGTGVGVALVATFTTGQLGVAVAVMVLVVVALTVHTIVLPVTRTSLMITGFISGITGTATSIGGPPMALLYQHRDPRQLRCTLAVYFLIGAALSLAGLAIGGSLHRHELAVALTLSPMLGFGFITSRLLHRRVDPVHLRAGVLIVCAAGSLVLLIRSIGG